MSEKDNIRVLDGGKTPNMTAESVRQLRSSLPALLEHMALMAKLQKAKFDALKSEGFTEAQALELSRTVF